MVRTIKKLRINGDSRFSDGSNSKEKHSKCGNTNPSNGARDIKIFASMCVKTTGSLSKLMHGCGPDGCQTKS